MTTTSDSLRHCVRCGGALPPARSGRVCPRCLAGALLGLPEEPAAEQLIGKFGEYELLSVAGRGGMGVVYRARHVRLGREVALKMVASPVLAGEAAARRFRAEVEAMAGLDHPHLIPIYECGEVDGQAYYTMKLLDGGQLSARLGDAAWPQPDKIRLLVKVARAVEHAHRHGVLHRDLKPSNIMLDAAGEPYVCDFGLARRLESDSSLTLSGAALGTPEYMAPEQAGGKSSQATTLADVYSLGAILYEFLTGRPPFRGSNALETMRQVMENDPVSPSTVVRTADRDLETIALKCLAKEPARRYASAALLADDLERWLRHEPITARRPGTIERTAKWLRRHPARAAVMALGLAAGGVFLWQHWREEQRVKSERDRAEAGWANSRARFYAADMDAVADALDRGDYGVAAAKLEGHRPAPGTQDERGLEWHIYQRAVSGDQSNLLSAGATVTQLAWSPDGTLLAAATAKEEVVIWKTSDWSQAAVIPDKTIHQELDLGAFRARDLTRRAKSADKQTAAALLALVNLDSRPTPHTRSAPAAHGLTFSPDGSLLATADHKGTKFWRMSDRWLYDWLPGHGGPGVFLDNTHYLVAEETAPHALGVFDLTTGEWKVLHAAAGNMLHVTADRSRAAVVDDAHATLTVFALPGGAVLSRWEDETFRQAVRIALIPGDLGIFVHSPGVPRMRQGDWKQRVWQRYLGEGDYTDNPLFALSGDGKLLAMYDQEHHLRLHFGADGSRWKLLRGARSPLSAMSWNPANTALATGEDDGSVRLWQPSHQDSSWTIGPPRHLRGTLQFSADGSHALSRTADGLCVVDLQSGETVPIPETAGACAAGMEDEAAFFLTKQPQLTLHEWRSGKSLIRAAVSNPGDQGFTPDWDVRVVLGRWLMLRPDKKTIRIHDINDGTLTWSESAEWNALHAALSPDGRTFAVCSEDGSLRLFDWPSAVLRKSLTAPSPLHSLTWLPDGRTLAAGCRDGIIRLFRADDLSSAGILTGHTGNVLTLHASADGRRLVSSATDSRLRLWDLATLQPLGRLPAGDLGPWAVGGFTHGDQGVAAVLWSGVLVVWRGREP